MAAWTTPTAMIEAEIASVAADAQPTTLISNSSKCRHLQRFDQLRVPRLNPSG
jgi:hypothetical protein